ncbi:MAG TPA: DUF4867 family protein [Clostridia bacterium]|nr:DUF4867 family protein [Clostridia bacterium]
MKIYQITDAEFATYGKILEGYPVQDLLSALESETPIPEGCDYMPEEAAIQTIPAALSLEKTIYGGLPVQFGWCNGHNTKLNCLEYHRSSEILLGTEAFILLLAKEEEIRKGQLDTSSVKAFRAPAGVLVELFATTLHYAPCQVDREKGFRVLVILPKGTNTTKPDITPVTQEDKMLSACNKWLLAHAETDEAKAGAWVGLTGKNIDLADEC